MAGGAERHSLGADGRIGALAVIRGDQPRNIHQAIGGCRLASQRVDSGTHVVVSAALLSAMLCMSSFQDLTKDCAPSTCSFCARASTSIPAAPKRFNTSSASPPSGRMTAFTCPLAANASRVFSGIVSTVSGAANASTYRLGEAFGSLVPVLAHNMRCFFAPAADNARQRLPATSSQCARYVRIAMAIPKRLRNSCGTSAATALSQRLTNSEATELT